MKSDARKKGGEMGKKKSIKSSSKNLRDIALEELKIAIDAYNKTCQPSVVKGVSKKKQLEEKQLIWKQMSAYKDIICSAPLRLDSHG